MIRASGAARLRRCPGFLQQAKSRGDDDQGDEEQAEALTRAWQEEWAGYCAARAHLSMFDSSDSQEYWTAMEPVWARAAKLSDLTRDLIPLAIQVGVDEAPLLVLERQLRSAEREPEDGLPPADPGGVDEGHAAEILVQQIRLRRAARRRDRQETAALINQAAAKAAERVHVAVDGPMVAAEKQRQLDQRNLVDTAFGREALILLAAGGRREISAFNGCGGQRWDSTAAVKERGSGYDYARKALVEMERCGLLEGSGRSGYRITDAGKRLAGELH